MFYPREAKKDHLYNRIVLLTVACLILLFLASLAKHSGSIYGANSLEPWFLWRNWSSL